MSTESGKKRNRTAGILLHPSSLPGRFGIGDLGAAAYRWIDALVRAKQKWWQILPLGPTGYGDSPYQCFSAFAGNPYLVAPEILEREGLLDASDLAGVNFPTNRVDFGPVIDFKVKMLARAWANFQAGRAPGLRTPFQEFRFQEASWLEDFGLFMALKDAHGGQSWLNWPRELIQREPTSLQRARHDLAATVGLHEFRQFLFFRQWREVKKHAAERGIQVVGDAPIFVSSDSADVWANSHLFLLDEQRRPRVVAGVPPDYFSATGQLWGNPLYDWEALRRSGYAWWSARLRAGLQQVDLIRIDHFRGFESYWEVPAGQATAVNGRWVKAPGADLFNTLRSSLRGLPLIAEDLGLITVEVEELRDQFQLPGMRILQFAFGGGTDNKYLPHHYEHNTVVYTGTHDNDTTRGWYASRDDRERDFVRRYLGRDGADVAWDFIRLAWSSVADHAVAPLQDVLDLGSEARMNTPAQSHGNWGWRYTEDMLTPRALDRLGALTELYSR